MGTKHQKFEINLEGFSKIEKEAIAIEVIDYIRERTQERNVDKNNKDFKAYSKKNPKKGPVDLTISSDMLDSIEILDNTRTKVVIGYEAGTVNNGKADGNIRGTYGQQKPIDGGKYARDFLGISKTDLKKITDKYKKSNSEKKAAKKILANRASEILSGSIDLEELEDLSDG